MWNSLILMIFSVNSFFNLANAHGDHHINYNSKEEYNEQIPPEFEGSWERWHMFHEHQLDEFTPDVFFRIHAVSEGQNVLTSNDILRMYGLQRDEIVGQGDGMGGHDDSELVSPQLKDKVVSTVMNLMDKDGDGTISLDEYLNFATDGGEFPDFGIGPGHEYDFEEEYEKHHWLEFHANEDPDINIVHKEDVEHELLHHFHEIEHDDEDMHENPNGKKHNVRKPILVKNIPPMFQY
ncbi:hypothetical protein CAS74_003718 [Pichia kudriavzevii]|nr:hypothetical protein JL09_g2340 [Pichia kudriavzevii]MDC6274108.1 hypothetical protein [Lacticaseibacillus paracasei]OUT21597.1 hypothetical protein CAS74_003718 [Pichia kudriavzevii]